MEVALGSDGPAQPSIWRILSTFVSVLVFGLTIVGTYLAADAIDKVWVFWAVVPAAAVGTAARYAGPLLAEVVMRVRNYPRVLAAAARQEQETAELKTLLDGAVQQARTRYAEGVDEGRREIAGAYLAYNSGADLTVEALSMANGYLQLFAYLVEGNMPEPGARFDWVVAATSEVKGVVEVMSGDTATGKAILMCVKRISAQFWTRVEQDAHVTPSAPPGMALRPPLTLDTLANEIHEEPRADGA